MTKQTTIVVIGALRVKEKLSSALPVCFPAHQNPFHEQDLKKLFICMADRIKFMLGNNNMGYLHLLLIRIETTEI